MDFSRVNKGKEGRKSFLTIQEYAVGKCFFLREGHNLKEETLATEWDPSADLCSVDRLTRLLVTDVGAPHHPHQAAKT